MTRPLKFLAMSLLVGCSAHRNEPPALPQGNMPMTEQEYREFQLQLRECPRHIGDDACH